MAGIGMVVGVGFLLVVGVHRMAPALFFVFFLLPLLIQSAEEEGTYFPDCPGMSCGNMGPLFFPFTNATRPECGLIKVSDCNKPTQKIQFQGGGRWYDMRVSLLGTAVIRDQELKNQLKSSSCDALNSLTLPISPFWYFRNITMYKCNRSLSVPLSTDFNYTNCSHVFHYNHLGNHLPSLPSQCSIIQLPVEPTGPINAEPFSFLNLIEKLSHNIDISLDLLPVYDCLGCKNGKGQCRFYHDGTFQCVKAKTDCVGCKEVRGQCGFYHNGTFQCVKAKTGGSPTMVKRLALGIGLPVVFIIILLFFYIVRRRYKRKYGSPLFLSSNISSDPNSKSEQDRGCLYFGIPIFSYSELEEATNNFDSNKELGDGGFGTVYYGKLQDGREVAVKRLYESNYRRVEQFMNEVEILTRLRHKNLVSLYGCTSRHSRELLLVYEYIPNGTVADHLHGDQAKPSPLSWSVRMSIAIETASALAYLHSSDIIHRDVKTNNILLDDNFNVKVADFGLSRLFPTDVTHISTAPQGTPGYVDPEYHQCYQLTVKSDVYSFGVVLVELISSLPAVDISRHRHEINLSNLALNKIQNRAFHELVDPCLGFETNFTVRVMTTLVAELAFRCLQQDKEIRPSMEEVLEVLEGIQNENYEMEKTEESENNVGVLNSTRQSPPSDSDDIGLLKRNMPLPPSPVSVTENWVSSSTIHSASSG